MILFAKALIVNGTMRALFLKKAFESEILKPNALTKQLFDLILSV